MQLHFNLRAAFQSLTHTHSHTLFVEKHTAAAMKMGLRTPHFVSIVCRS